MRLFEFQIKGLTREELERRQKNQQPANVFRRFEAGLSLGARAAVWAALALGALFILQSSHTPSIIISGKVISARNAIILEDTSGSMSPFTAQLKRLTDQLESGGILVDNPSQTKGGGFSMAGSELNSLHRLESALRENPAADSLFVFSDFTVYDAEWDENDPAGYRRLRQLLRDGPRRLYLGTVNKQPADELQTIARESGGDLIDVR